MTVHSVSLRPSNASSLISMSTCCAIVTLDVEVSPVEVSVAGAILHLFPRANDCCGGGALYSAHRGSLDGIKRCTAPRDVVSY